MKKLKSMLRDKQTLNLLFIFTVIVYSLVLCRGLLFKYVRPYEVFSPDRFEYIGYNLIPFNGAGLRFNLDVILNTILFVPFGFLLSMKSRKNLKSLVLLLIPFASSIVFETLQYILHLGAADITDVIMNSFGGFIGYFIYLILYKIFGNKGDNLFTYAMACVAFVSLILLY